MPVTVKRAALWRSEVENQPGTLARTLEPLASAGSDLQVVMGYSMPGDDSRSVIEVYPITGRRATTGAESAGLKASQIPSLIVEGDNQPGLGHTITKAIGDAGVNMSFLIAQVVGRRYSAVIGFENEDDARKATALIKKASASGARSSAKRTSGSRMPAKKTTWRQTPRNR
jgi:hypothetical protein